MNFQRITKIVLNTGVGRIRDDKEREEIVRDFALISGQKPMPTLARKAVAAFKTRTGMVIGYKITLRGKRMRDFFDRLIHIAFPRTRDFRGVEEKAVDAQGNLTIGIREHTVFPEPDTEHSFTPFGFEISIATTTKNRDEALALFRKSGVLFRKM
ncbi:MAG: 50S ribosomal protein L5 [Patescibacteria group bacterium]|mgnify:CR=1 FL=1